MLFRILFENKFAYLCFFIGAVILTYIIISSPPTSKIQSPTLLHATSGTTAVEERHPKQHPFTTLYSFSPFDARPSNKNIVGNITSHFQRKFGGEPASCYNSQASFFSVEWVDTEGKTKTSHSSERRCLDLGIRHTVKVRAFNASHHPVCSGGDFIEVLLSGTSVRSAMRFIDTGDGTYTFYLHLPDDPLLEGLASITFFHLWSSLGGVFYEGWFQLSAPQQTIHEEALELRRYGKCTKENTQPVTPILQPPTKICHEVDFMTSPFWEGYWVAQNKEDAFCKTNACSGSPLGVLSTSWVYRLPQCIFHLYSQKESQSCLNGSWFFSSGDSNGPDTVSNLAQFTLGLDMGSYLDQSVHTRPTTNWEGGDVQLWEQESDKMPEEWPIKENSSEPIFFHATNVWNSGIHECCGETAIFWGISVTKDTDWKDKNIRYLTSMGDGLGPDILFVNSGLHDGMHYLRYKGGLNDFVEDLEESALPWWNEMANVAAGGSTSVCRPRTIWRHSVASAGPHRTHRANPQSMAIFNRFTAEAFLKIGSLGDLNFPPTPNRRGVCKRPQHTESHSWRFLDMYDLTFPFHFDLQVSDGGHFGRHHCDGCDSVDRMQIQVLLNGLCKL
jgi:hypothetical protein